MRRFSKHHLVCQGRAAVVVVLAGGLGCGARGSMTVPDETRTAPDACALVCTSPASACFASTGTCTDGVCSIADIDCQAGCDGGVCGVSPGPVVAIAAGGAHTCALTSASAVKCWGRNNHGQLGNGSTMDSNVPVDVVGLSSGVAAISAGDGLACALTTLGAVKCWGDNTYGSLGSGSTAQYSNVPVDVVGLSSGVAAISSGGAHTCALTVAGTVKCWGYKFGNGTKVDSNVPVDVLGLPSNVAAISAGGASTCVITAAGAVKCWGGSPYYLIPYDMPVFASGVIALSGGSNFMCAVTTNGAAQCFGTNYQGELGDGSKTEYGPSDGVVGLSSGVISVSTGYSDACALTVAGALHCWGYNAFGQLGDGSTVDSNIPVDVVGLSSGVIAVSAGGRHSCALTASGSVKCWGMNIHGELGDGTTTESHVPVDVAGF